jgi:two-component system KDP operon response regulator KdpE
MPPPRDPLAQVLVVDDDAGVRDVCTTLLHVLGYSAREAKSGVHALASLKSGQQDVELVLLDLEMPEMRGDEVLSALKKQRPDVRVLLMSGRPRSDLHTYLRRGADAVLSKPFSMRELSDTLGEALKN